MSAVSKMNRNVVKLAATTEKPLLADRGNISRLFAQNADKTQRFRSSPKPTDLYIAAIALQKRGNNRHVTDNEGHYHS